MSVISEIKKLYTYRDNIANIIRSKGVTVPENTKLKDLGNYLVDLNKNTEETEEFSGDWSEELAQLHILEAQIAYNNETNKYTGHVDEDGLHAIGWNDYDIEYFKTYGIDWMEEDDDQYLVSDYEKELYTSGAMATLYTTTNINNNTDIIVEWRNNIRWMPKFSTANLSVTFIGFEKMIGTPLSNFSNGTSSSNLYKHCRELRCCQPPIFKSGTAWSASGMFQYCEKLRAVPAINWSLCNNLSNTFRGCTNLIYIPKIEVPNCTNMSYAFYNCINLLGIEGLTTSNKLTNVTYAFENCHKLKTTPMFNTSSVTSFQETFANCYDLLAIPSYDLTKVTTFSNAWRNCKSIVKLPDMNFGSIVTSYANMCQWCKNLKFVPTTMDFTSTTSIANAFEGCISLEEFPYKLTLNSVAANASEGIKSFSTFITEAKIKEIRFNKIYSTSDPNIARWCTLLENIEIDDIDGGTQLIGSPRIENTTKLSGELRGIRKSLNIQNVVPNIDKESLLRLFNAIEDVNDFASIGLTSAPKLTIGTDKLRILTADEKAIATSKGWVLA